MAYSCHMSPHPVICRTYTRDEQRGRSAGTVRIIAGMPQRRRQEMITVAILRTPAPRGPSRGGRSRYLAPKCRCSLGYCDVTAVPSVGQRASRTPPGLGQWQWTPCVTSLGLLGRRVADEGPLALQFGAHARYHLPEHTAVPVGHRSEVNRTGHISQFSTDRSQATDRKSYLQGIGHR